MRRLLLYAALGDPAAGVLADIRSIEPIMRQPQPAHKMGEKDTRGSNFLFAGVNAAGDDQLPGIWVVLTTRRLHTCVTAT